MRTVKQMMMVLLLPLLGALLWTGCATNSPGGGGSSGSGSGGMTFDCDSARRVYTAYLASMLVRDVSESEIEKAQAAGAFLAAWCGWEAPKTPSGRRSLGKPVDQNGVPILIEPAAAPRADAGSVIETGQSATLAHCLHCTVPSWQTAEMKPEDPPGAAFIQANPIAFADFVPLPNTWSPAAR